MRPLQLWLESRVPWTAWTRDVCASRPHRSSDNPDAPDDHDGCIDSRLGSSVRGNASFGTVAGISEPVALKPPGAGSSLLSSKGFSATAGPAKCTDSHRQHVCGFVYKSSRRVEIAPRVGGIKWMSGQTEIQMRWLQRPYLDLLLVNKSNFDIWNSVSRASLTKKWRNPSLVLWATTEAVFLALKDFQPQLKQQHVLICTDNTSVFIYKSSRRVEIAPRVGSDDLEPLALRESGGGSVRQEREHALPVVASPLTSRWPAASPYAFPPIKKCYRWCYERSGWSEHQWYYIALNPAWVPWLDGTAGGTALPFPRQEIFAIPGRTWNYRAIMCDRFRGIRGDGRLTVSHAHGSAKTLYKTFVCFKWECLWRSQAHIDPTTCTVCSEFPAAQTG